MQIAKVESPVVYTWQAPTEIYWIACGAYRQSNRKALLKNRGIPPYHRRSLKTLCDSISVMIRTKNAFTETHVPRQPSPNPNLKLIGLLRNIVNLATTLHNTTDAMIFLTYNMASPSHDCVRLKSQKKTILHLVSFLRLLTPFNRVTYLLYLPQLTIKHMLTAYKTPLSSPFATPK